MTTLTINSDLILRPLTADDAENLFALTDKNRAHLREWLPWLDGTKSAKDSLGFIELSARQWEQKTNQVFGIFLKGKLSGVVDFQNIDQINQSAYIGYWLAQDFMGQGIITKACQRLIKHGFEELNLNRIEIRTAPGNIKSEAVPKRLGFKTEGTLRKVAKLYEKFVDLKIHALLKSEWLENR